MENVPDLKVNKQRSNILLRFAGTFSLVYYGLSAILFILALVFNDFIIALSETYYEGYNLSPFMTIFFLAIGLILHILVLFSLIKLMNRGLKKDYIWYILSAFSILLIQFSSIKYEGYHKFFLEISLMFLISLFYFIII
jgi:uncharacterized protein YacL